MAFRVARFLEQQAVNEGYAYRMRNGKLVWRRPRKGCAR
jgi:hypothetical protein